MLTAVKINAAKPSAKGYKLADSGGTYSQPFGHGRQMNWAVSPNELGTSAEHLGSHSFVRRIT